MKTFFTAIIILLVLTPAFMSQASADTPPPESKAKKISVAPSYAWTVIEPLGLRKEATIDTLFENYSRNSVPSFVSDAWITTGNLGAEGKNMIFSERKDIGNFFLADALRHWYPSVETMKYYNTRIPMTLVSYNTGGGRETTQDRFQAIFSGNINAKAQIGAGVDYLYSKGSYNYQALKHLNWNINGSYMGDRYEFQGFYSHHDLLNKENGGITDPLYITDPGVLQGGNDKIDSKAIPTNLRDAHTRIRGEQLFLNHRYKVGFWEDIPMDPENEADTIQRRRYVPVTSFIWTMQYTGDKHLFLDRDASEIREFFGNTFLNPEETETRTSWHGFSNTVGISLLEGFNKYSKFGLSAFATYEIRKYTQTPDTINREDEKITALLTPFPEGIGTIAHKASENLVWVGGQLTKQRGSLINYEATAKFGVSGRTAGDMDIVGSLYSRFPIAGDTLRIKAFAKFENKAAPYLLENYISNHFIWKNDFDKYKTFEAGGSLAWDKTGTKVQIIASNLNKPLYFNTEALPVQDKGSVQVLSVRLNQKLKLGILHWDNTLTYQNSSNQSVLPLPKLTIYSNLYILCRIATLHLQLGIDCDYYTKFFAPAYQPATATFYNQQKEKLGNYPYMNLYANMKLSRARFYVMMTHVNQGIIGGKNYFSSPLYPLNPRRFLLGVSVDFAN